ncbi:hypothetical protein PhCBS80983_g03910 [Powellomyces hirtus]|uniref:Senescence domain-containing protein n=1 Tax=Powellomyces hirtus TaxID=109895 RepID=A0A507E2I7_9FUNG|nr:hypothetical protein PhCBS80983_g03910 [Powellomyces hirtus]
MNVDHIESHLKALFKGVLNKDTVIQRQTIERAYFPEARLQNPYLVRIKRGPPEAAPTYGQRLKVFVAYDDSTQSATVSIFQTIKPKALGGIMAITTHQQLQLQLERDSDRGSMLRIVDHAEKHIAQDIIKQMPIFGKWYEHGIRTAVGQISMAGTSVLNATGLLDLVPAAVRVGTDTATAVKIKATRIGSRVAEVAAPAWEATGVTPLVRDVYGLTNRAVGWATSTTRGAAQMTRSAAARLIEDGRGDHVDCYSPTCKPGQNCYSPTCPRGKHIAELSVEMVGDIVKGAYQGVGRLSTGFLKPHDQVLRERANE